MPTVTTRTAHFPPLRSWIIGRVERWARERQGDDGALTRLRPRRIYILPTPVGFIFALMSFAILLGSMNYNNNLSFVLTFMLVSVGFVSMHQCQRNLVDLEVTFAGVDPVFAGQSIEFRIAVTNHAKNRRHALRLFAGNSRTEIHDLTPGESHVFRLTLPTARRGYVRLERFGIRSVFPFELFRAWAWLHMDLQGLVYPHPAADASPPPPT
ncbi:MAG TPA: hypothetical protein VE175_05440, partial [Woeseiaceae bacterium]|nr:hypothetical protein [Woeseiaceae bacterium]